MNLKPSKILMIVSSALITLIIVFTIGFQVFIKTGHIMNGFDFGIDNVNVTEQKKDFSIFNGNFPVQSRQYKGVK